MTCFNKNCNYMDYNQCLFDGNGFSGCFWRIVEENGLEHYKISQNLNQSLEQIK